MSRKIVGFLISAALALTGLAIAPVSALTSEPVLVKDLSTGVAGGYPRGYVQHDGVLYFAADDESQGNELFIYNVASGATRVFDVNPVGDSYPSYLTFDHQNEILYFMAYIGGRSKIFKFDVNTEQISEIHELACDIWSGFFGEGEPMMVWNGDLFFYGCEQKRDFSLWKYESGSTPTPLSFPGRFENSNGSQFPVQMAIYNGSLYFIMLDSDYNYKIAVTSDGINARYSTHLADMIRINDLIAYDGYLMFSGQSSTSNDDLYKFDGNQWSYVDQFNNSYNFFGSQFTVLNNKLYLSAYDSDSGDFRLFEVDSGEMRMIDLAQAGKGIGPREIQAMGDSIYFIGGDRGSYTPAMYVYDGVSISAVSGFPTISEWWPSRTSVVLDGKMYFTGSTSGDDYELWVFDGVQSPTQLLDINQGTVGSWLDDFRSYKNKMYWINGSGGFYNAKVMTLSDQNVPVEIPGQEQGYISGLSSLSSGLYFWLNQSDGTTSVWVYTGSGNARKLHQMSEGDESDSPFIELNQKVYSLHSDKLFEVSLDGSIEFESSEVIADDVSVFGDYLYFNGYLESDNVGTELYRWNGTGAAELVVDINGGAGDSFPHEIVSLNTDLFFVAKDGSQTQNSGMFEESAEFLYRLTEGGTLTKLSEVTCSFRCDSYVDIREMHAIGNSLFASVNSIEGNRQLLKFNSITGNLVPLLRDGQPILGVGHFAQGNTFTTIDTYVEGVGCVAQKLNENGTLTDLFNENSDYCMDDSDRNFVMDFNGNYYFGYDHGTYGFEISMLVGAGTPTAPGKISKLVLARNGATKSSLKLTWKAPALTGGKAITNYKIEYSLNGKKWTVFKHKVSKLASITITKLKKKTKYYVRVSAVSSKGTGASTAVRFSTK